MDRFFREREIGPNRHTVRSFNSKSMPKRVEVRLVCKKWFLNFEPNGKFYNVLFLPFGRKKC
jgi:hypothetical protein